MQFLGVCVFLFRLASLSLASRVVLRIYGNFEALAPLLSLTFCVCFSETTEARNFRSYWRGACFLRGMLVAGPCLPGAAAACAQKRLSVPQRTFMSLNI